MDAHKNSIKVAVLLPGQPEPVEWTEDTTVEAVRRLGRKLQRLAPGEVQCCYEAGPTGYALQRQLRQAGMPCTVIAPSLTPVQPGVRIKTDRRDARKLAELFRAGLLTEVHPPSESDEALRDLCRCRDDVRVDLLRARHRLSKFLLRRHCIYRQVSPIRSPSQFPVWGPCFGFSEGPSRVPPRPGAPRLRRALAFLADRSSCWAQ